MAKISDMLPSSYLKQSDFDENGTIVTVSNIEQKNIARDDEPEEHKWIVTFREYEKGMVLNSTNIQALGNACGSDDTDDWLRKEVIVYVDPNVGYAGKITGGLRIKKHSSPQAPKQAPQRQAPRTSAVDDIPY
jgi:hypothetical protein